MCDLPRCMLLSRVITLKLDSKNMKIHKKIQNLQSISKIIELINLLGKFFSQPHQLDVLGKIWKHQ